MKSLKTLFTCLLCLACWLSLAGQTDIEQQLKQLKRLYDQQLITKAEYDSQRKQILNTLGQIGNAEIKFCHFITAADEEIDFSATEDDRKLVKVSTIIKKILEASGNVSIFELRANRTIPNATAVIVKKKRFIQYNPEFVANASSTTNDWTIYGVFAHEIGHHINFHLDGRNDRHIEELEADDFCGFILNKLGASLSQAQTSIRKLCKKEAGSATHPSRSRRLKAVEKGWKRAEKQQPRQPAGMSEHEKKFHELVDEADRNYDDGDYEAALRRYERAKTLKSSDTYVGNRIEEIKEKLAKQENIWSNQSFDQDYIPPGKGHVPPPPPKKQRGTVTVVYRGDNYGCALNLKIRIGDREFYPSGSSFSVTDIPLGFSTYEISGTVSCSLSGMCTISPLTADIEVLDGAVLYVYWQNTAYGTCTSWLSYQ